MNIVILTYLFYPEPIVMSTITEDLAVELSRNHSVVVVSSHPCRPYGYPIPSERLKSSWTFKRVYLDSYMHPMSDLCGRLHENISFGKAAKKYIRDNHTDIDVIYMNVFPLFAQNIVIREAKKYGISTINHVEDIFPEPFKQKVGLIGRLLYSLCLPIDKWNFKNATKSVVIGKKIKDYLVKTRGLDVAKIEVVYNWQETSRFEQDIKVDNEDMFTFMYVGSLSRAADLYNVVDGFVNAMIPASKLILAGTGNEKASLIEYTKDFDNIYIYDAPFNEVPRIQAKANVLILPLLKGVSLRAVPSKLPSYLFSKKPVLACVEAESDVANILTEGNCGWIVPPQSPFELANMMKVISNYSNDDLSAMGVRGCKYAKSHLVKDVNLRKLVEIIQNSKS